jgi:hypothetical protein
MQRFSIFLLFLLVSINSFSQVIDLKNKKKMLMKANGKTINGRQLNDTIGGGKFDEEIEVELSAKTYYTDYKIISHFKDTTVVDTTLSLRKDRLFNYIRKNNFELIQLHNLGQTFNNLGYDFSKSDILPQTGMRAKYYNFYDVEDIKYYRVPTPTSELFYRTGIQQGHILNSLLTTNLTPQLNISIAYKGLRSLGDYRNALASHQNLRATTSFETKNKRYQVRLHFVAYNLINDENGGLTNDSMLLFESDDKDSQDRERLEVNISDAESVLKGKRYYLEHVFNLWQHKDSASLKNSYLQMGHEFKHSRKHYLFNQDAANSYFGSAYQNIITDSTYHRATDNSLFVELKSKYVLGTLRFKTSYSNFNYGYNNIVYLNNQTIPEKLKGNTLSIAANWNASLKSIALKADAGAILQGDLKGNYLKGIASFSKDSLFTAKAILMVKSQSPNFNYLLYQSDYINYNWYPSFENENTRFLGFKFKSEKLVDIEASITQKDFYTYFDEYSKPKQYNDILSYLKIKAHKTITYKKISLDNTLLYQKVSSGNEVFKIPEFITENTLYFTDYVFKGNPLFLQTGITFKYFTKYQANEFNPLLNEFVLQNTTEVGGYPMFDIFINGQIRRTRLFFKLENAASLWTGRNYFATPTQPYRDMTLRFGLVWNFFI